MHHGIAHLVEIWVGLSPEEQKLYLPLMNRAASFLGHPDLFSATDFFDKKSRKVQDEEKIS